MLGFVVVLIGSFSLATQNVLLRVIFIEASLFGLFSGGLLQPSLASSLLTLQMRSLLMLPIMAAFSTRMYPQTWASLRQLFDAEQRSLLRLSILSSTFLWLALALLFVAIAQIPAGVATVLFFSHPAMTVLLSWRMFGDRPSPLRIFVVVVVLIGTLLVAPPLSGISSAMVWGVVAALVASVAYSIQGITAQMCFPAVHPVPFTVINLVVMLVLSSLSLLVVNVEVPPENWLPLWGMMVAIASLALVGQLFYNIGIHLVSAALMSIIAISNPTLTAVMGWVTLGESLQGQQIFGGLMVILGLILLGREQFVVTKNRKVSVKG